MIIIKYSNGSKTYDNKQVFPDGTPLLTSYSPTYSTGDIVVYWNYENDSELFRLYCIVRDLQEKGTDNITLVMPYIPNARMDRVKSDKDVLTLKYFAEYINSMNFNKVFVLDAHSDVSLALINRCENISPVSCIERVMYELDFNEERDFIVYPDAGCKKRLEDKIKFPSLFGNKNRDWKTGNILGTDIYGDLDKLQENVKGAKVLFVDDICAYGGTAKFTLEMLKQFGVEKCYCYFTHTEKSIFGKDNWRETGVGVPTLLTSNLVDGIYTTDSLISEGYVNIKKKEFNVPFKVIPVESFIDNYIK